MVTAYPSPTSSSDIASPMPAEAPVTIAARRVTVAPGQRAVQAIESARKPTASILRY